MGLGVAADRALIVSACFSCRPSCSPSARARADPAALALPQPHVRSRERDRLHRRLRPLRRDRLPAALPADHEGVVPDDVRAAAGAADGGRAPDVRRERASDLAVRSLPAVPDRGHGRHGARPVPALAPPGRHADLARDGVRDGRPGSAWAGDAGARARRAERRRPRDMGVATSGSTLFRQIGGSIGVALFGAIFANRLTVELASRLPRNAQASHEQRARGDPRAPGACPLRVRGRVRGRPSPGVHRRRRRVRRRLRPQLAPP